MKFQHCQEDVKNAKAYNSLVDKANELGIIEAYHDDLAKHDLNCLSGNIVQDNERFFWYVYDCGTHLFLARDTNNSFLSLCNIQQGKSFPGGKLFFWTGSELVEVVKKWQDYLHENLQVSNLEG